MHGHLSSEGVQSNLQQRVTVDQVLDDRKLLRGDKPCQRVIADAQLEADFSGVFDQIEDDRVALVLDSERDRIIPHASGQLREAHGDDLLCLKEADSALGDGACVVAHLLQVLLQCGLVIDRECVAYDHIDGVRRVIKASIAETILMRLFACLWKDRVLVGLVQIYEMILTLVSFR